MKPLFIGQLVRIVGRQIDWLGGGESPIGKTGRIAAKDVTGTFFHPSGMIIQEKRAWGVILDDGRGIAADSTELEPILPSGHEPVAWDQCLWQPTEETATT